MGGGSIKSNVMRSLTPMALRERTVEAKLVLWISGTAVGSNKPARCRNGNINFPGPVLPARGYVNIGVVSLSVVNY